jgi:hypothetical protein
MNYKSFNLGDWIGHISGVIEDETTLDGNEMRDLVEFLTTLKQEPILDKIRAEIIKYEGDCRLSVDEYPSCKQCTDNVFGSIYAILDKYKAEGRNKE